MIGRWVVLLLAANLAWFAWSQGWLRVLGLTPQAQTQAEPERLARQLHPEALTLTLTPPAGAPAPIAPAPPVPVAPPPVASPVSAPAPTPASAPVAVAPEVAASAAAGGTCLQAGVFDDKQIDAVRRAAASLPAGSWRIDQVQLPGRWMVYMGKLADAEAVAAKRTELRALDIDTDRPGAALEPGLSLGRFSTEEAANRGLENLSRKGVRTARVVQERRDTSAYLLRLPNADATLRRQARGLRGPLSGRDWRECG